jgi:HK97 family phage major capsid protein
MNKHIRELQARKAKQVAAARAITDKAAAEGRDLTDAEVTEFDAVTASIKTTDAAIERQQLLAQAEASVGLAVSPEASISGGAPRIESDPKRGFKSFGDFARTVKNAGVNFDRPNDERLRIGAAAPTTFGNEGAGADGGFAVPPEFARNIYTLALGEDSLIPYTENVETGSNSMVFPKDETTPWGSTGIRAYWQSEGTAGTQTKPVLGTAVMRLNKLMALVPMTDELLQDTNALDTYVPLKVGQSIRWKSNEAILFGLGNGTPEGAYKSNASVTIAKESGQATLTLQALNLAKMVAALPPGAFSSAIWLIGPDVLPALFTLSLNNYPIYLPIGGGVGGLQASPYGTLLGRPVFVSQHAAAFSSAGDVLLFAGSYYRTLTKAGGLETATSMHIYFDADATAFRTIFRLDGQSKIYAPITQAKGSQSLSPFVQLGAR